jgi:hypothetical protein
MIAIPIVSGLIGVLQRYLSACIGEGVIFDLRRALYEHMQLMSLRFFTNTRTGELMSRLNNDVVGAQQAVTSTTVSITSNAFTLVSTLAIMLTLEWRFPAKPGNGGVLLRMVGEDKVWPKSIEAQLQHENAGDFWNIDEFQMKAAPERTKGRNTKKEHPHNEKPLGEWNKYEITVDGGREWKKFMTNLPNVRVDDILIHPRDRDLILATHGRSIWISDDITPLEQLGKTKNADLVLFDPRPAIQWKNDLIVQRHLTNRDFRGQNPQGGAALSFWARADMGEAKIEILQNGQVVRTLNTNAQAGLNRIQWDMQRDMPAAAGSGAAPGFGGRGRGADAAAGQQAQAVGQAAAAGRDAAAPQPQAGQAQGRGGRGGGGGGVPFVSGGGRGGGGSASTLLEPGTYVVRLTAGGRTLTTSVTILEDIWKPEYK